MDVDDVLARMGGLATRRALEARCGRPALDRALMAEQVIRVARGRYALPGVAAAPRAAHTVGGVLCLEDAVLARGWEVKSVPDQPHVIVGRRRRIDPERARGIRLHRGDLLPEHIDGIATSVDLTLEQCLRHLSYDAALTVADSALRHGVGPQTLQRIALSARGAGARQVRRVAGAADGRSANPFESVLRAISHEVPGLRLVPQRWVTGAGWQFRPDLVDEDLLIIAEADSFEWHGGRAALRRDARRYDELTIAGWMVLRFAWEDVMHDPLWVRGVLASATQRRTKRGSRRPKAA